MRKLSIIWVFCIVGLALLQENLDPASLETYGVYLKWGMYAIAAILVASLIIVKNFEKNQLVELDKKQDKIRKYNEEAQQIAKAAEEIKKNTP